MANEDKGKKPEGTPPVTPGEPPRGKPDNVPPVDVPRRPTRPAPSHKVR